MAFAHRSDPKELARALATWRQAQALGDDAALRVSLSRAEHFAGQSAEGAARKEHFEAGRREATAALELAVGHRVDDACAVDPTASTVPALYWLAESLDAWSREVGLLGGAKERRLALCLARRLSEADPGYFHAGPLRLLGRLLAQLPTNLGGDAKGSKAALEHSIQLSPEYLGTQVDLASTVAVKLQDLAAFESALSQVLEAASLGPDDVGPENRLARAQAQRLQAEKRTLFK
ncbi:MAG: TRAP transporter TatT component family protein [Myxococcales bacterium]